MHRLHIAPPTSRSVRAMRLLDEECAMNARVQAKAALGGAVVCVVLMLGAVTAHAASRCDGPTVGGEARACAAEREGPDALRRFVTRTRAIYEDLYFADLRHPNPEAMARMPQPRSKVAWNDGSRSH
jgi:hypothetical protein